MMVYNLRFSLSFVFGFCVFLLFAAFGRHDVFVLHRLIGYLSDLHFKSVQLNFI